MYLQRGYMFLGKPLNSVREGLGILMFRIALHYLLADQGEVCGLASVSCCFHVSAGGLTEESADRLLGKATQLTEASQPHLAEQIHNGIKQALPSAAWFLPFLSSLITIALWLIFGNP